MRRSKLFQLCLTRVLRERDLAGGGEDTRMFGPVVRRHATAGQRGMIGSRVQGGSAPDDVAPMPASSARRPTASFCSRTVSGATGWCLPGLSNARPSCARVDDTRRRGVENSGRPSCSSLQDRAGCSSRTFADPTLGHASGRRRTASPRMPGGHAGVLALARSGAPRPMKMGTAL
jgi:hypothetical protein